MELGGVIMATFLSPPLLAIFAIILAVIIGVIKVRREDIRRKQKEALEESRRAGLEKAWGDSGKNDGAPRA